MITSIKTTSICLACMAVGAALVDPLESLRKGAFDSYYQQNTGGFWLSIAINMVVIDLLAHRALLVVLNRMNNVDDKEKPGVYASLLGVGFKTNAFIRICLYVGFYLVGVGLFFIV